jgi:hypothetical protein
MFPTVNMTNVGARPGGQDLGEPDVIHKVRTRRKMSAVLRYGLDKHGVSFGTEHDNTALGAMGARRKGNCPRNRKAGVLRNEANSCWE